MIRLSIPTIEEDDLQAVCEVLDSGFLVQGQRVANFELAIAAYVGTKYAVAVSNCTAALHLALLALNVRSGDLVIVPTYSWVATANVAELCGAQPIFVDIQPDTFNMDPGMLNETLNRLMSNADTARRVKAVLPVHTFGQMADISAILEIARRYGLPVIEDAACALGAKWERRQAGSWGVMGCFSFHPRKAITTGEGGVITTNDPVLAHNLRALRNHGQNPDSASPDFILPGFNYRMTEFQAALGVTQMAKLDRIIAARRRLAADYDKLLTETLIQAPAVPLKSWHVYQSYIVQLPASITPRRAEIIRQLKEQGVETNIGTWHMPLTNYFKTRYGYKMGNFPITDSIFSRSLTLPLYESLSITDQEIVVKNLLEVIGKIGE
jgi:perosamine synthetase